jgi:hypothetical protein
MLTDLTLEFAIGRAAPRGEIVAVSDEKTDLYRGHRQDGRALDPWVKRLRVQVRGFFA